VVGCDDWIADGAVRSDDRVGADGHQEGFWVLDRSSNWATCSWPCGVGAFCAGSFAPDDALRSASAVFLAAGSVYTRDGGGADHAKDGRAHSQIKVPTGLCYCDAGDCGGRTAWCRILSKDSILFTGRLSHRWWARWPRSVMPSRVCLTALLTSFYMFRRYFSHLPMASSAMTSSCPCARIAVEHARPPCDTCRCFRIFGGWFALPSFFGGADLFRQFPGTVFGAHG